MWRPVKDKATTSNDADRGKREALGAYWHNNQQLCQYPCGEALGSELPPSVNMLSVLPQHGVTPRSRPEPARAGVPNETVQRGHAAQAPLAPSPDDQLVAAAGYGELDEVQQLVAAGANVNFSGSCGFTPLHAASIQGATHVVQFLLGHGADLTHTVSHNPNKQARVADALALALSYGHADTAAVLLEAGQLGVCTLPTDATAPAWVGASLPEQTSLQTPAIGVLQVACDAIRWNRQCSELKERHASARKVAEDWHARRQHLRAHQRLAFAGGYHARIGEHAVHTRIGIDLLEAIISELDQISRHTAPRGHFLDRFHTEGWAWQATSVPLVPRQFNLGSTPKAARKQAVVPVRERSIAAVAAVCKKNRTRGRRTRAKTEAKRRLQFSSEMIAHTDGGFAQWATELRELREGS